ncbi:MAG TPA: hypothetical protein VJR89_10260 [Polyangiales bacterium]|nr:hypothetical protein [Polyangiales bacterium]
MGALGAGYAGCSFESPVAQSCLGKSDQDFITCALGMAPVVQPASQTRETVYEAPGRIRVLHGSACVDAAHAANSREFGFRIQQSELLPKAYADSATVFMNGWNLRYANGDHHVQGFGSAIVNISESRQADGLLLQWEAGGVLADQNGDDPYQWCYTYTIVGWMRASTGFDAVVGDRGLSFVRRADPGNSTSLHTIDGAARNIYGPGVVLPQGFAMMWDDRGDRHLLQAGFDLGKLYASGSGQMAWTTRTLLKDNAPSNDYYAAELVSTLTYNGPQWYHPAEVSLQTDAGAYEPRRNAVDLTPFAGDTSCTAVGYSTPRVQNYRVDVPYAYAVPVLSGWELGYVCTDHHVREIGASITDWRFERRPDGTSGTLYYTVELPLNDDSDNVSYNRVAIDVLGMKPMQAGPYPLFGSGDAPQLEAESVVE